MSSSRRSWLGKHGYLLATMVLVGLLGIDFALRYLGTADPSTDSAPRSLSTLFGFYPIWTLLSAGAFVLLGNIIAFLFWRRESYYDE